MIRGTLLKSLPITKRFWWKIFVRKRVLFGQFFRPPETYGQLLSIEPLRLVIFGAKQRLVVLKITH